MALRREEADEQQLRLVDRIDEIFAAHEAAVAAMFEQAQVSLDAAPPRRCTCDYCRYHRSYSRAGESASEDEAELLPRLEILFVPNREPRIDWGIKFGSLARVDGLSVRAVTLMPDRPPNWLPFIGWFFGWEIAQGVGRTDFMTELDMLNLVRAPELQPPSTFHHQGTGRGKPGDRGPYTGPIPGPPDFSHRRSWIILEARSAGPSYWPIPPPRRSYENAAARRSDGGRHRAEILERFSDQLWKKIRRRPGASDGTDDRPPVKGPSAVKGTEVGLKLPRNRRNMNADNPESRSVHVGNEIPLDVVADINRRGLFDPRTCTRRSWPYGAPPEIENREIRLAGAIVDSSLTERPRFPHTNPTIKTSSSTAWRRPVEIEETHRAGPDLSADLWQVLSRVGLAQYYRPGDLSSIWPCVRGLTDPQIDALVMKEHVEMTETEIARHMGIARSGAHKHVQRGRRNCARFMWVAILLVVERP
jgi:hypothetical protein